jgi:hypothetical protein
VAEPFRDGLEAALERAERLADENEDLRDELERVKHAAHDVSGAQTAPGAVSKGAVEPPPDSQAKRIFTLLDKLAEERDSQPDVEPVIPPPEGSEPETTPAIATRVAKPIVHDRELVASNRVLSPTSKKVRGRSLEEPAVERWEKDRAIEERERRAFFRGAALGFGVGMLIAIVSLVMTTCR